MSPKNESNVATLLGDRIIARSDFKELVATLEHAVAKSILSHDQNVESHGDLLFPAMRFADILSYSSKESHRTQAYYLVALFQELKELSQLDPKSIALLDSMSAAILAALGNFPGLQRLEGSVEELQYTIPADRVIGREIKELVQRTSDDSHVLTDAQFEIAQNLKHINFYSFSGPTSLGKSFVIKDYIRSEVSNKSFKNKCAVFVVPTNALVSQTARDLRRGLKDVKGVNVAIHPVQPQLMLRKFQTSIYVFTPERLIRYLSTQGREVELLVVDEAHRIVSPKDSRSPLFYYAIDQTLRKYASKLVFSSPSISNPGMFLDLFGKSSEGSLLVHERTVTQQRFFIDQLEEKTFYFPSSSEAPPVEVPLTHGFGLNDWEAIKYWANGNKSLVYVNTPNKVVKFALEYQPPKGLKLSQRTQALIDKIKEEVHPEYFLVDALERGVAFHHGRLPVAIREEIEAVFKDPKSGIDYLVCTSTLLEGVNLPAKNIFVLTDKHGSGQVISKIDFENLAGRAGRLTEDFKGNVFCLRIKPEEWNEPEEKIRPSAPQKVSSFLLDTNKRKTKWYRDLEKVLLGKSLPKSRSVPEIEIAERYAAILMIQNLSNHPSLLTQKFNDRAVDANETLKKVSDELHVNLDILKRSPEFDPGLQEIVRRELSRLENPVVISSLQEISFDSILAVLVELSRLYNWKQREGRGFRAMFSRSASKESHNRRLRYWAQLVFQWMTGRPIKLVIQSALYHHKNVGKIRVPAFPAPKHQSPYRYEEFDLESKEHVNHVIEETMTDIEYGVGFRILSYLKNYHDLCVQVFGEEKAGLDLSVLIEFGTTSQTAIELQQSGFSRDISSELLEKGSGYLEIGETGTILDINVQGIISDEHLSAPVKQETKDLFAA
ncbi:hypothetical protein AZH44_11540 [Corynebacterium striatum]|uniref:DEAD/DEAH box helicase n=1 Tax=Corynebacterium striatum TaxID=43770 RepID=UPI000C4E245E|nr:DEAD/DEAH box helicase [Corynebacterium striatum]PIS65342.1 hypothetical protein AZH44_11540 [Corynebacterium striatum]